MDMIQLGKPPTEYSGLIAHVTGSDSAESAQTEPAAPLAPASVIGLLNQKTINDPLVIEAFRLVDKTVQAKAHQINGAMDAEDDCLWMVIAMAVNRLVDNAMNRIDSGDMGFVDYEKTDVAMI